MSVTIHATAVSFHGQGVVIVGPSGCGKSALALHLLSYGAVLIADDQVVLTSVDGQLIASCPANIDGLIEARGVGILNAEVAPPTPVVLAVDMGQVEQSRIPEHKTVTWLNHEIPLFWGARNPNFAVALLQMLKAGRSLR